MLDRLNTGQLMNLIRQVTEDLSHDIDLLSDLDAAAGDGDLGVTVELGMKAVVEGFDSMPDNTIGTLLATSGLNFNRVASSTFGTICATALMRAGKVAAGKHEINGDDIVEMIEASEDGIRERGKASLGDKTVLDALDPLREEFTKAIHSDLSLERALVSALKATEEAVERTKNMKATMGRAKWISERAMGHLDPGATALLLMLRAFVKHLKKVDKGTSK